MTTERVGVYSVGKIFEKDLKWYFRELSIHDYGIDAHVEMEERGRPSGKLIGLQIKTGQSYFKVMNDKFVTFYIEPKHYSYWASYDLPVLIILYDDNKDIGYWCRFSTETCIQTEKGWKIEVPLDHILSSSAKNEISKNISPSVEKIKLNNLAFHRPFMKQLRDSKNRIIVEVEEWINKSSGRGSFKFYLEENGILKEIDNWGTVMFPGWTYTELFKHMFPWAHLSIDYEFYDMHEEDNPMTSYGYEPPEIRPYKNVACEVDFYRLALTLNDLGESFLRISDYLEEPWKN